MKNLVNYFGASPRSIYTKLNINSEASPGVLNPLAAPINNVVRIIVLLFVVSVYAQIPPPPPPTPTTTTSSTSSSLYSETTSDGDGQRSNTNISIATSDSEDSYSFRAKFPSDKYKEIKEVLENELKQKNKISSKGRYIWNLNSSEGEVYQVSLNNKRLSMSLDKEIASSKLVAKFKNLGNALRTIIAGKQTDSRREADRLQREADKLLRDAERMKREAERLRAMSVQDAKVIGKEAKRLADEASKLNTEASRKGGISAVIRELLGNDTTYYADATKSAFNWSWPLVQSELISVLKNNNLINTDNDMSFVYDASGMYANGARLNATQVSKIKNLLSKNGIVKNTYFSFYKGYQHIVIVDDEANIEGFLKDMVFRGFLSSKKSKVLLEINGSSLIKNSTQLSSNELSAINSLLLKNKIIPSPGKIFEIMKPGNYKLGYKVNSKSHLGTWQMDH